MTEVRKSWRGSDVPYFGGRLRAAPVRDDATRLSPDHEASILPLAGHAGGAQRIFAVLIGVGALVCGAAVTGFFLLLSFVLSFGSPPGGSDVLVAFLLGGTVAIFGVACAVMTYRDAGRPLHVKIAADSLEIAYKTFKDPLLAPRSLVRVVAIDDTPSHLFTNNKRFPIAGSVPGELFADALDNLPARPWEDLDPDRHNRHLPSPAVIWENMSAPEATPEGYSHDDPERAGWASANRPKVTMKLPREAYLWSADGSSLPFLRVGPADIPNLAIIFHEPRRTPRQPWWFDLIPLRESGIYFRGGRAVRGILVRVRDAAAAERAFAAWGIVRRVNAEDIVEEGLLVAKPLAGIRAWAYAGLVLGSLGIEIILRILR